VIILKFKLLKIISDHRFKGLGQMTDVLQVKKKPFCLQKTINNDNKNNIQKG
jgi:hypothetical protein